MIKNALMYLPIHGSRLSLFVSYVIRTSKMFYMIVHWVSNYWDTDRLVWIIINLTDLNHTHKQTIAYTFHVSHKNNHALNDDTQHLDNEYYVLCQRLLVLLWRFVLPTNLKLFTLGAPTFLFLFWPPFRPFCAPLYSRCVGFTKRDFFAPRAPIFSSLARSFRLIFVSIAVARLFSRLGSAMSGLSSTWIIATPSI